MIRRVISLLLVATGTGLGADEIERLEVFPESVTLAKKRSRVQLVVTGWLSNGEPRDLTHDVEITTEDDRVAAVSDGVASAVGDGETRLVVRSGSQTVHVTAVVTRQAEPDPIRFNTEVLATLTKQGCNAGSCHGSPEGKAGFSLSLFGFNPEHDLSSLVREGGNRRLNVLDPDESLMLKKPLLRIPHVGGKKLKPTDTAYRVFRQWIFEGARADPADSPDCVGVIVHPAHDRLLRAPDLKQQLSVQALFRDGSTRDVTDLATYESSNRTVATVDAHGLVTGNERGLTAMTIRYLEHLESVYFTIVHDVPGFVWQSPEEHNYVDTLVNRRLRMLQIEPADTCVDAVFLRRVYLDLTGLLPPTERARQFLTSTATNKRGLLIDELLSSREFARFQALQMADLFRVTPKTLTDGRAELFSKWIADATGENRPFDQVTRDLLTATGDSKEVAPANYYAALSDTETTVETTAQIFMGSRIQCAKCHNHPFENWTQNNYYQIGAVFNRIQREKGVIRTSDSGEMSHPRTGEVMQPWGGGGADDDRRAKFADWLTSSENPYFGRVIVNRIWAQLLGRGIVEPVDDFRSSNPPSNVPLLDKLASDLAANGFDRRHIFRVICNSQVYQRQTATSKFNVDDEENFSHRQVGLLSAEQLNDAIAYVTRSVPTTHEITETTESLKRREAILVAAGGANEAADELTEIRGQLASQALLLATQRPWPEQTDFLKAFGQPERNGPCACERSGEPTLEQALQLLNGEQVFQQIKSSDQSYSDLSDNEMIDTLYLGAYSRFPNDEERSKIQHFLTNAASRPEAIQDIVWAIINTQEFMFQH